MKGLSVALFTVSILALEGLVLFLSGGLMHPAALGSLVPFSFGVIAIAASLRSFRSLRSLSSPTDQIVSESSPTEKQDIATNVPECVTTTVSEARKAPVAVEAIPQTSSRIYESAIPSLFASIVGYLNRTSDPMSETLVKIKTVIAEFLASVEKIKSTYENSDYSGRLSQEVAQLRIHITDITNGSSHSFSVISAEVDRLNEQMAAILELVSGISDVAERIHVLSINASIEAARAGIHGRGFKVIADEVQRLSKETQTFVRTIGSTAGSTKGIFASLHTVMEKNRLEIEQMVIDDSSTYDSLSHAIERQLGDFASLYTKIVSFIESINVDMTTLSPLAMLHAIITQEIENLGKVCEDFVSLVGTEGKSPESLATALCDANSVERLRKRLTTSRELDALDSALKKSGTHIPYDLKRTNTEIELF